MSIIYGNMVGSSGSILGKTVEILSDDGVDLMGVVVDQETVLTAKPSDIKIGKIAATDSGIIEGTNTINYRTEMASWIIFPNEGFSIPLKYYNQYDYTQIQCIIVEYSPTYGSSVNTFGITVGNCLYSIQTSEKLSDITKNATTKSVDLNIQNNSENIYEIFYFTYREDEEE